MKFLSGSSPLALLFFINYEINLFEFDGMRETQEIMQSKFISLNKALELILICKLENFIALHKGLNL